MLGELQKCASASARCATKVSFVILPLIHFNKKSDSNTGDSFNELDFLRPNSS